MTATLDTGGGQKTSEQRCLGKNFHLSLIKHTECIGSQDKDITDTYYHAPRYSVVEMSIEGWQMSTERDGQAKCRNRQE